MELVSKKIAQYKMSKMVIWFISFYCFYSNFPFRLMNLNRNWKLIIS